MPITLTDFISLDGVTQAPGGPEEDTDGGFRHGGWSHPYFDEDAMGPVLGAQMTEASGLLFGRRTWEGMAAAWPDRAGDPYADHMNSVKKYVVSSTLGDEDAARWTNTTVLRDLDAVRGLSDERLQIWGSANLASQLVAAGLIDEYQLMIEPLLLGGGKSIYPAD